VRDLGAKDDFNSQLFSSERSPWRKQELIYQSFLVYRSADVHDDLLGIRSQDSKVIKIDISSL
jgi:hypothetical protein